MMEASFLFIFKEQISKLYVWNYHDGSFKKESKISNQRGNIQYWQYPKLTVADSTRQILVREFDAVTGFVMNHACFKSEFLVLTPSQTHTAASGRSSFKTRMHTGNVRQYFETGRISFVCFDVLFWWNNKKHTFVSGDLRLIHAKSRKLFNTDANLFYNTSNRL